MCKLLDKVQPKNKEQLKQLINYAFKHNIYDLNFIDTSKITDMSGLFICIAHDFDVSSWDVSNAKNISYIFYKCKNFTGKGIENWDVSKVTDMSCMFTGCKIFDCDLSGRDVSNVTNMCYMFGNCLKFEGKGLKYWDVSNVIKTSNMFHGCEKLNCDLSTWDVSNIYNTSNMFKGCKNFKCKGLENWNLKLKNIKFYYHMFYDCDKNIIPNWYKKYNFK